MKIDLKNDRLILTKAAAAMVGCCGNTLRRMADSGKLQCIRTYGRRERLYLLSEIRALKARSHTKTVTRWKLGLLALLVLVVLPFEYMPGLWTCPRGYVIRSGQCLADVEVAHGPVMEVSTVPSAGDGAPGTVCPSGGCSVLRDYNSTYVHVYQHRGWRWR